jgi:hypothetical protein
MVEATPSQSMVDSFMELIYILITSILIGVPTSHKKYSRIPWLWWRPIRWELWNLHNLKQHVHILKTNRKIRRKSFISVQAPFRPLKTNLPTFLSKLQILEELRSLVGRNFTRLAQPQPVRISQDLLIGDEEHVKCILDDNLYRFDCLTLNLYHQFVTYQAHTNKQIINIQITKYHPLQINQIKWNLATVFIINLHSSLTKSSSYTLMLKMSSR